MSYKFCWKDYYTPTPANLRKLGDTILWTGGMITASVLAIDQKWLLVVGLILSFIGKALTNCFTSENKNNDVS